MKVEFYGVKRTLKDIRKRKKKYRVAMQMRIGHWMDLVRKYAKKEIISNTTGHRNPHKARRKQPSTSGRLTSRTGKLRHMLGEQIMGGWRGKGKLLYRKQTPSFKMQVRTLKEGKKDKSFVGTTKVYLSSMDSFLLSTGGKNWRMPIESKKTLRMRFNWETRMGKRPFMRPSALRNMAKLKRWLKTAMEKELGGVL